MAETIEDTVKVDIVNLNKVESELREVPGAPGLKWSLNVYPSGLNNDCDSVGIYIRVVGGSVTVNAKFTIRAILGVTDYSLNTFKRKFNDGEEHGIETCFDHDGPMGPTLFDDFPCTVTCTATFKVKKVKLVPITLHELINKSKSRWSDAKIVIGTDEVKIQRGFMSMISPVFNAMFKPETKESKTGVITITDFTAETVRNAVDYCYGVHLELNSEAKIIDMLRFYDKYDIQPTIIKLEAHLKDILTVKNFVPIAIYAWQYSRKSLQAECGRVHRENLAVLASQVDFVLLDPVIISGVLKESLKSTGVDIPEVST